MTDELAARVAATHDYPLARELGFRLLALDAEAGTVRCGFAPDASRCNGLGMLHGGVLVAMLDMAMTAAALGAARLARAFPTLEVKASFLAPARPGVLEATGRVLRLGRSVAFLDAGLRDAAGTLLAQATATARAVPREDA